ncbi:hypothetical protein Bccel_2274 [Pseudobacteroides cellulosolvens ATCC 35603 = DSM 2933]|uniref:Uncharacterized protein n=1 Tax=Pseudobacteroides cellulosolvens ATCC 35603 = DSM 2933 TaxID=398512 RepID=A0A0L6JML2_9FIRM|nr:hypothetical protein Bccel_2274 [Pseudobacteroides cellulosolvens ATCC 35603 = DSM 2933]
MGIKSQLNSVLLIILYYIIQKYSRNFLTSMFTSVMGNIYNYSCYTNTPIG